MSGKVIKGGGSAGSGSMAGRTARPGFGRSGGRVMGRDTLKAQSEAQEIIQKANNEAQQIIASADEHRQREGEKGHAQGVEIGKAEWTEAILRMNRENEARFRHFEQDLVKLSLTIAEKVIGEQIRVEPNTITDIVTNALNNVRHQREIYIRVNPEDYDVISNQKYILLEQLSRAQDIDIRPDPGIAPGGCLIESETGTVDASLEKQLAALERLLLGE